MKPSSPRHAAIPQIAPWIALLSMGLASCHLIGGHDDYVEGGTEGAGAGGPGTATGSATGSATATTATGTGGQGGCDSDDWVGADCASGADVCHRECSQTSDTGACVPDGNAADRTCQQSFTCQEDLSVQFGVNYDILDVAYEGDSLYVAAMVDATFNPALKVLTIARFDSNCNAPSPYVASAPFAAEPANITADLAFDSDDVYLAFAANRALPGLAADECHLLRWDKGPGVGPVSEVPASAAACSPANPIKLVALPESTTTTRLAVLARDSNLDSHLYRYDDGPTGITRTTGLSVTGGFIGDIAVKAIPNSPDLLLLGASGDCEAMKINVVTATNTVPTSTQPLMDQFAPPCVYVGAYSSINIDTGSAAFAMIDEESVPDSPPTQFRAAFRPAGSATAAIYVGNNGGGFLSRFGLGAADTPMIGAVERKWEFSGATEMNVRGIEFLGIDIALAGNLRGPLSVALGNQPAVALATATNESPFVTVVSPEELQPPWSLLLPATGSDTNLQGFSIGKPGINDSPQVSLFGAAGDTIHLGNGSVSGEQFLTRHEIAPSP